MDFRTWASRVWRIIFQFVTVWLVVSFLSALINLKPRYSLSHVIFLMGNWHLGVTPSDFLEALILYFGPLLVIIWTVWSEPQDRYWRAPVIAAAGAVVTMALALALAGDGHFTIVDVATFVLLQVAIGSSYFAFAVFLRQRTLDRAWYWVFAGAGVLWLLCFAAGYYAQQECWGASTNIIDQECNIDKSVRQNNPAICAQMTNRDGINMKEDCYVNYENNQPSICMQNASAAWKGNLKFFNTCTKDPNSGVDMVTGYQCDTSYGRNFLTKFRRICDFGCKDGACIENTTNAIVTSTNVTITYDAPAASSSNGKIQLAINDAVNPAPVHRGEIFTVSWATLLRDCAGSGNYVPLVTPTAEGKLWTDQRNLPSSGSLQLRANTSLNTLQIMLSCIDTSGTVYTEERFITIV